MVKHLANDQGRDRLMVKHVEDHDQGLDRLMVKHVDSKARDKKRDSSLRQT